MSATQTKWLIRSLAVLEIGSLAALAWQRYRLDDGNTGVVSGNGRVKVAEFDIASRTPGRVNEIRVTEGDFVTKGEMVAVIDTGVPEAQRRQGEAQLQQTRAAVDIARSELSQREGETAAVKATITLRDKDLESTRRHPSGSAYLAKKGLVSARASDDRRARMLDQGN